MTIHETATQKVNEVLEKTRSEYETVNGEIEKYQAIVDKAAEDAKTAESNGDLKAYSKARGEMDKANEALTMYKHRREILESEPLLPAEEYEALCNGIIEEVENYFVNLKKELYTEAAKLEKKNKEAAAMIDDSNKLLHSLQYDANRGADLTYNAGAKFPNKSSIMEINNREFWEIVAWCGRLHNDCAIYEAMKKERGANE